MLPHLDATAGFSLIFTRLIPTSFINNARNEISLLPGCGWQALMMEGSVTCSFTLAGPLPKPEWSRAIAHICGMTRHNNLDIAALTAYSTEQDVTSVFTVREGKTAYEVNVTCWSMGNLPQQSSSCHSPCRKRMWSHTEPRCSTAAQTGLLLRAKGTNKDTQN